MSESDDTLLLIRSLFFSLLNLSIKFLGILLSTTGTDPLFVPFTFFLFLSF